MTRVYKPSRKKLTQRQLLAVWDSTEGRCHLCGFKILVGQPWDADHVEELRNGGADEIANMRPAHRHCHVGKTAEETARRAKADRIMAKQLGIKRPKRIMPGSRASKWKITLWRGTVRRQE